MFVCSGPYTLSSTVLNFRGLDVVASNAFCPALRPRVTATATTQTRPL
jgi:hypothetical protein